MSNAFNSNLLLNNVFLTSFNILCSPGSGGHHLAAHSAREQECSCSLGQLLLPQPISGAMNYP